MQNFCLHYCSKFETNLTTFGGVMAQKKPNGPIYGFSSATKIYNLRTTNAMKMKFGTLVYLHETYHLTKDLSVTYREWQGVAEKPLKKAPQKVFLCPFLGIFSNISKPVTYAILCLALHHW